MKIILLLIILLIIPLATAAIDLNEDITEEDKETFNEILTPVMKIYNFLKYSASAFAALFLIFSAISYMSSGDNPGKREGAKKSISYIIVGLMIIWAVPYAINFLV